MRGKQRTPSEICADCGALEPGWASLNRGVLICDECCSVHRSLGRHISQIRSLHHGITWPRSLFEMVHALVSSGANSIWEHSLLDPSQVRSGKRKPVHNDPLHPSKSDFIRAKYQKLDFVLRMKDEDETVVKDLNKQLHSSVRTGNLETCLRLLSLGAQANFFNEEKQNAPLHVASKEGQALQCELLMVYGADPGALDSQGQTPADLAREEGHLELAERLVQCQYELTDRLTFYVCGKKADHATAVHFLIPEMSDSSADRSDAAEKARKKLQALSNRLFEELAMDVYDEVDRREQDALWSSLQMPSPIGGDHIVPFLPLNPELSSTRNQGRQKLARFNAREFATLIIDILKEAKRRQQGTLSMLRQDLPESHREPPPVPPAAHDVSHQLSPRTQSPENEPLYDSVASDEDYKEIDPIDDGKEESKDDKYQDKKRTESAASSECSEEPISLEEYMELKKSLAASEAKVSQLLTMNKKLNQDVHMLQSMVDKLNEENAQLRALQRGTDPFNHDQALEGHSNGSSRRSRPVSKDSRPASMFEPRSAEKPKQTWKPEMMDTAEVEDCRKDNDGKEKKSTSEGPDISDRPTSEAGSDYDNAVFIHREETKNPVESKPPPPVKPRSISSSSSSKDGSSPRSQSPGDDKQPSAQEVISATEKITKNIQQLLCVTQEGNVTKFIPASDEILGSVKDMASLFPDNLARSSQMRSPLRSLKDGASRLQEECKKAATQGESQSDQQQLTQVIISCAYDIAKAAKLIVSIFQ